MTLTKIQNMLDMFLDRTVGESYNQGRLTTEETESGNVALIAYGWLKIAEYNESRELATVFSGHTAIESVTVNRWLNQVTSRAKDRGRDVVLSGESPTVDTPNKGTKYIGNYISYGPNLSAVEKDARAEVVESLA